MFRDGLINTILSLIVCYLLSFLFLNISFFNPLTKALQDFSFLDVYYSERLNENQKVNPNIVLINVEHKSREEIGVALKELLKAKPKVVGFDIILKDFKKTAEDTLLAFNLNDKRVINSLVITEQNLISNHPFFTFKNKPGFVNFNFENQNSVIRDFDSEKYVFKGKHESFSVILAREYLPERLWDTYKLDKKLEGSRVINYQGNLNHFLNMSIDDFMALNDKSIVKEKIVLFGYLGAPTGNVYDIEDKHFTPLNSITSGKSIPDMFGVVIHANIIAMIISNSFMHKIQTFWILILTFLFSFLASIYFIWLNKKLKISYRTVRKTVLFVFTILLVWVTLLLFKAGIVLNSTPIIVVTVFSAGFIKFYKHLVRWLNTKTKFKSYLN
ncbi:CHASE2 domain-containing sensor protein [Maribacter spongiicola]|uniref:CHASE2 domain-containing sensor protein n=1 Tax=Maribacter spongiicola TaxID=1206753 RepID=A0A4R7K5K6_9FLAO|nr:CHASE2 domain-containing sensor protein [Maribacter spongiicola]